MVIFWFDDVFLYITVRFRREFGYCKPTLIRDHFISRFTGNKLVCGNYFWGQALSEVLFTPVGHGPVRGEKY